jgi:signal transduction histidine kinase
MNELSTKIFNEDRLKALASYSILDTLPEEDYDNLTAIAASICGTPISLVSLIDDRRQWFKSRHGLSVSETPVEYAFCAHALNNPDQIFTVHDARTDNRFKNNPLVTGQPHVIFYAGVPLIGEGGFPLGTLCVIDHEPRALSDEQLKALNALSRQVMNLLELRRSGNLLEKALNSLKEKNSDLERFAFIAAHDLKTPLINISSMGKLFLKLYQHVIDEKGLEMVEMITGAADDLSGLVDGLLDYSRCDMMLQEKMQPVAVADLKKAITGIFKNHPEIKIDVFTDINEMMINKTVIMQILINLVTNAVKYNDKQITIIDIGLMQRNNHYECFVKDNGPGIAENYLERIFVIFEVLTLRDRFGNHGHGIGLATVKKLIEKLNGTIRVESEPGRGACFNFTIPVKPVFAS